MRGTARAVAPLLDDSVLADEIALETRAVEDGVIRYRNLAQDAVARGDGSSLKPFERLQAHWFEVMEAAVDSERRAYVEGAPGRNRNIHGPILQLVSPAEFAVIVMQETLSACAIDPGGVKASALTYAIGRAVLAQINMKLMAATDGELIRELERRFPSMGPGRINWWASKWLDADAKRLDEEVRTRKGAVHIGAFLLDTLIDYASCDDYMEDFVPAVRREVRREGQGGRKQVAYIRLTDECWSLIDDGHHIRSLMRPRYLPMLVRPYRWSKDAQGGYVQIRTPFISKPTPSQKKALADADLEQIWDCLDAVSGTAWRVNRLVKAVQVAFYEQGGGALGIPRRDDMPTPPKPAGFDADAADAHRWRNVDPEVKKAYKRASAQVIEENINGRAARNEFLMKRHIAEMFEDRPHGFYYPHQLCFRGRAYPIPPHLNHQNDDVARGMLEFAEGVKPGEEGRRELMIEAANCFGNDKLSYDDRVRWTADHMRKIAGAAEDPLGDEWWMKAEDPWQFLAACFALTDPDAAAHGIVRRDGSVNGLQHFSALGRDPLGAAAVNLVPGPAPNDAYADVARAVRRIVADAAENAETLVRFSRRERDASGRVQKVPQEIPLRKIAAMLEPHINRKVIKQSVMTSVYGVTRAGASAQILARLKEAGLSDEALYCASNYLADVVLSGIGEVYRAAAEIMAWLRTCAKAISDAGHSVQWTTPCGLPVVQPYRKYKSLEVATVLGDVKVRISEDERVPVRVSKQVAGCSPNFIHGVDASHMMLTARACRDEGIAFAACHDSYWSHAANCRRVARINREQFVAMHSRY
jgi:DNA-directed RNA polymerase